MGDVLLGFGLVFFGLATMKAGFGPLGDNPAFIAFFTKFSANSISGIMLCVLAGAILTMILQSSSATVGITMALAMQGLLSFEASVALILGENIGTTITAQLACVGANLNAHRTANAHTLFNVLGVIIIILFFPIFIRLITFVSSSIMQFGPPDLIVGGEKPNIARYIANSHTLFNVVNAFFFLLILPYLVMVTTWITPQKKEEKEIEEIHHLKFLDTKFVDVPSVAIAQARAEIIRMGRFVLVMYDDVIDSIDSRRLKELSKWRKREDDLDNLQKEITQYLVRVMQKSTIPEESREISSLMRTL